MTPLDVSASDSWTYACVRRPSLCCHC